VYEYSSALLSSVMETLTAEGMITQIIPLTPGRVSFQYIADIVERYNLRGLIIQEFEQLYEITPHLKKLSVPTVCVGDVRDEVENSVRSDSYGAGRDAAAYLWSLGHRSFGVLTASLNDLCQKKRLDGFCEYIKEAGGNPGCIRTKSLSNPEDPHSAVAAAADLANMRGFPDALFSTNSSLTLKLLIELKKFGLTAPENFSLISVEERDELELLETPVTAVKQPVRRMGETSVKMLLGLMRGSLRAPREILACGLVPRGTTRPKKG
jgi:LacI family transcriptional regulator